MNPDFSSYDQWRRDLRFALAALGASDFYADTPRMYYDASCTVRETVVYLLRADGDAVPLKLAARNQETIK